MISDHFYRTKKKKTKRPKEILFQFLDTCMAFLLKQYECHFTFSSKLLSICYDLVLNE